MVNRDDVTGIHFATDVSSYCVYSRTRRCVYYNYYTTKIYNLNTFSAGELQYLESCCQLFGIEQSTVLVPEPSVVELYESCLQYFTSDFTTLPVTQPSNSPSYYLPPLEQSSFFTNDLLITASPTLQDSSVFITGSETSTLTPSSYFDIESLLVTDLLKSTPLPADFTITDSQISPSSTLFTLPPSLLTEDADLPTVLYDDIKESTDFIFEQSITPTPVIYSDLLFAVISTTDEIRISFSSTIERDLLPTPFTTVELDLSSTPISTVELLPIPISTALELDISTPTVELLPAPISTPLELDISTPTVELLPAPISTAELDPLPTQESSLEFEISLLEPSSVILSTELVIPTIQISFLESPLLVTDAIEPDLFSTPISEHDLLPTVEISLEFETTLLEPSSVIPSTELVISFLESPLLVTDAIEPELSPTLISAVDVLSTPFSTASALELDLSPTVESSLEFDTALLEPSSVIPSTEIFITLTELVIPTTQTSFLMSPGLVTDEFFATNSFDTSVIITDFIITSTQQLDEDMMLPTYITPSITTLLIDDEFLITSTQQSDIQISSIIFISDLITLTVETTDTIEFDGVSISEAEFSTILFSTPVSLVLPYPTATAFELTTIDSSTLQFTMESLTNLMTSTVETTDIVESSSVFISETDFSGVILSTPVPDAMLNVSISETEFSTPIFSTPVPDATYADPIIVTQLITPVDSLFSSTKLTMESILLSPEPVPPDMMSTLHDPSRFMETSTTISSFASSAITPTFESETITPSFDSLLSFTSTHLVISSFNKMQTIPSQTLSDTLSTSDVDITTSLSVEVTPKLIQMTSVVQVTSFTEQIHSSITTQAVVISSLEPEPTITAEQLRSSLVRLVIRISPEEHTKLSDENSQERKDLERDIVKVYVNSLNDLGANRKKQLSSVAEAMVSQYW